MMIGGICGFIRPSEWQCGCGESPCVVQEAMRKLNAPSEDVVTGDAITSTWADAEEILDWLDDTFTAIEFERDGSCGQRWNHGEESLRSFLTRIYLEAH